MTELKTNGSDNKLPVLLKRNETAMRNKYVKIYAECTLYENNIFFFQFFHL
jgi:hypothetical protein